MLVMNKDPNKVITRIHGAPKIKTYIDEIQKAVGGYDEINIGTLVEVSYHEKVYEDNAFRISYIPLYASENEASTDSIDVAFLLELKV